MATRNVEAEEELERSRGVEVEPETLKGGRRVGSKLATRRAPVDLLPLERGCSSTCAAACARLVIARERTRARDCARPRGEVVGGKKILRL